MMKSHWQLEGRTIGPGAPVWIVAELSANHRQQYDEAVRLVEAAHACGADAVKVQTYTPQTMTIDAGGDEQRLGAETPWAGRRLAELYAEAYMPWEWQPKLAEVARQLGLAFFSSPFDASSVEFLESIGCPAYKIASFEVVDLPLLRCVAQTGKPVIMSTGMASWDELCEAIQTLGDNGCRELALLKCVSSYPARPDEMNLKNIPLLASRCGVPVGLSDHTLGAEVAVAATALGACVIEKHLTLSRDQGGPDASFSLEPQEFRRLVASIRTVEQALGSHQYEISPRESANRKLRRSLHLIADVAAGETLASDHIRAMRPAGGLEPRYLSRVLGRKARRDLPRGTPLEWAMIEPDLSSVSSK